MRDKLISQGTYFSDVYAPARARCRVLGLGIEPRPTNCSIDWQSGRCTDYARNWNRVHSFELVVEFAKNKKIATINPKIHLIQVHDFLH